MKRYMIAIGGMFIVFNSNATLVTAQLVKREYESAITAAFLKTGDMDRVRQTFYDYPIDSTALNLCYKAAAGVKMFVADHSKNLVGIKDSVLNKAAAELEKLTIDTINAIKTTRNSLSSTANHLALLNSFSDLDRRCYSARSMVEGESFTIAEKKESKDVLLFTLNLLRVVILAAKAGASMKFATMQ